MATAFSETTMSCCQMCSCDDNRETLVCFTLQSTRQSLCDVCARKSQQNILVDGVLSKWTCQKHTSRKAEIFCENHKSVICHTCATTLHKSCDTKDVEDDVDERTRKLLRMIEQTKQLAVSKASVEEASTHLARVQEKLQQAREEEEKVVEEEGQIQSELINKEADEEIEKINIRREESLRENLVVIEQGRQGISKRHCVLLDELQLLNGKLQESTKASMKFQSSAIENTHAKANALIADEILLLQNFVEVEEMFRSLQVDQAKSAVQPITQRVQKIDFKRESGPNLGQLLGLDGTWVLRSTLDMELWEPALIGSTNKDNVIVIDKKTKSLVLVDHQEQRKYKVMDGDVSHNIYRLALLDDDRIVCGTTDGSLHIYRKHTWELIETIPLHLDAPVIFAVDHISHERRILAVAHGECIINIVSPTSKVVTSSVSFKDKPILDIAVLCHGHIVVRTRCDSDDEIIVLDRKNFAVTSVTRFHDKSLRSIAADQGRDALYVRLFDRTLQKCCIEEMRLIDGKLIYVGSIMQFAPMEKKWPLISADCYAPEPGKLVLHRGRQIKVFTKELLPH